MHTYNELGIMTIETHPLAPFLPPNARVLLLGSFPPPQTRWKMNFYYPNYQNDMWRIIGLIFYRDPLYFLNPSEKSFKLDCILDFLNQYGIAISDVAYRVERLQNNASDKHLNIIEPHDITGFLTQMPACHTLITTGEKATDRLLQQFSPHMISPKIGQVCSFHIADRSIQLYRLPSSSRAYPLALEKKADYYRQAFQQIFTDFDFG